MTITVKSVRRIKLDQPIPVYDATSPEYHNFVLANGVVVHNTAKKARDTTYQECYPVTGKISNAIRTKLADLLKSKSIIGLLQSIGYDHKAKDVYAQLRVRGGIYLLADPDPDGKHINTLFLSLLYKLVPKLFDQGKVFVCNAPLYSTYYNGTRYYGSTYDEVAKQLPKKSSAQITRSKGWGELAPETLEAVAFNPKTRYAIKVQPVTGKELKHFLDIMGPDTSARKKLLGLS